MKTTPIMTDTTPTKPEPDAQAKQRSIWKPDHAGSTSYTGPSFHNNDTGADCVAYHRGDGLKFFFEVPNEQRPDAEYKLAELQRLHRALGRLLEKVTDEPKPQSSEEPK